MICAYKYHIYLQLFALWRRSFCLNDHIAILVVILLFYYFLDPSYISVTLCKKITINYKNDNNKKLKIK